MKTQNLEFTIKQVAEATGLTVHTLRYYERVGLIHPIDRADNSHRRYSEDDIGWIDFLKKLRATGMTIQDMQTYAQLQREGDTTLAQRVKMLKTLQHNVEAHIHELTTHLDIIRYTIDYYSGVIADSLETTTT